MPHKQEHENIAYYVHVDEGRLQTLRKQPALVSNIGDDPRFVRQYSSTSTRITTSLLGWLLRRS